MSGWLPAAPGSASAIEGVLGWRPELLEKFKLFYGSLWDEKLLDPELLELARLRIAQMHGCEAELALAFPSSGLSQARRDALARWQTSDLFSPGERALIGYAERIPFQHHFIEEEDAAAVREHLDEKQYVAFSLALAVFDGLCRLKMAFGIDDAPAVTDPAAVPASAHATLY